MHTHRIQDLRILQRTRDRPWDPRSKKSVLVSLFGSPSRSSCRSVGMRSGKITRCQEKGRSRSNEPFCLILHRQCHHRRGPKHRCGRAPLPRIPHGRTLGPRDSAEPVPATLMHQILLEPFKGHTIPYPCHLLSQLSLVLLILNLLGRHQPAVVSQTPVQADYRGPKKAADPTDCTRKKTPSATTPSAPPCNQERQNDHPPQEAALQSMDPLP